MLQGKIDLLIEFVQWKLEFVLEFDMEGIF